jgi:hypothetical protein
MCSASRAYTIQNGKREPSLPIYRETVIIEEILNHEGEIEHDDERR